MPPPLYRNQEDVQFPLPLITLHGMHSFLRSEESYKLS